ncbi:4-alpha-glucanotransferase [Pseudomonas sp. zfem002]|uniref:4-alpha-glucanotransferase n=1 Tax=Pseudomonas sp. zfem002 TaxID=3078197 RepID=UPI002929A886|nr:4-alpha-glucanotransferase [Pseudomonas sp. zfem002]MDU9393375.1 4-alpha-glucanotransferase [Pseudomonas sp. zfem002]
MSDLHLHYLARRAGVVVDWIDANGRAQQVSDSNLRRILGALGHPADDLDSIELSLERLEEAEDAQHLPPLLTVDIGASLDLSRWFDGGSPCQVHLEDGSEQALHLDRGGALPAGLPIGYHQLRIGEQTFSVAVAPLRCYTLGDAQNQATPRSWGIAAQLYSLRRPGDGGFGDCLALEALARGAAERGADALAISPTHAMFANHSQTFSPYSPSSRVFFNALYASPEILLGERAVRVAREALGLPFAALEQLPLIDWAQAATAKQKLLRALYRDFSRGEHPQREDFLSFRKAGGQALEDHCRYEALLDAAASRGVEADWRRWFDGWRDPRSVEVAQFADNYPAAIEYYAFCQWLAARSLERVQQAARGQGMAVGLIADLAVGADGAGSQAWSRQDELLADVHVGAPPDILNRAGQNWGISAFSPQGLKRNGFRAFIEMLRANLAHAGGLRIDHVMGLHRLWLIPAGAAAPDGAYLHYPLDDLLRLLALESHRHRAIILGEDLGTVPEGLRDKLAARGILGMRVLLFEQDPPGHFKPILDWPDNALATTSTHDLPPLAGWLESRDIDWNQRLQLIDAIVERDWRETRQNEIKGLRQLLESNYHTALPDSDALIDASVRLLGHTRAPLVLLPLEDLLGVDEQPNLPGTIDGHPNWRRRFAAPVRELLDDSDAARRLELLAQAREQAWERDR